MTMDCARRLPEEPGHGKDWNCMSDWKRVENPAPIVRNKKTAEPMPAPAAESEEPVKTAKPASSVLAGTPPVEKPVLLPKEETAAETPSEKGGEKPEKTARQDLIRPDESSPEPAEKDAFPASDENRLPGFSGSLSIPDESGPEAIRSPRYTKRGRRKGRLWYAAPLGFLVLVLAVVGVVSLILTGINAIQKAQDDTPLRKELNDFLLPVMQYCPSPFTNVNDEQQDALLLAAIWRITKAEQVRQYREDDQTSAYPEDEEYRILIPIEEIEASYRYLFGPDAVPNHHSIEEESQGFAFEYDPDNACYHVPFTTVSANYVPVIDTLKRQKDTVTVRVAYVSNNDIAIDDNGNEIQPIPEQATYAQIYTVVKTADGWALTSIAKED